MNILIAVGVVLAASALGADPAPLPSSDGSQFLDAGPFYWNAVAPSGASQSTAAGPLVEHWTSTNGVSFEALRPLVSRTTATNFSLTESLWPIATMQRNGLHRKWRFLVAYGRDTDISDPRSRWYGHVFPLVFSGRDKEGQGYFAVFPLGGSIHEFIGQDTIDFVLFPLYARHQVNDVRSWHVLWPFVARAKGGDVSRFRVVPFYGYSRDNDQFERRFIMWPFWTSIRSLNADNPGGGFILFPLFGRVDTPEVHGRWVLPPFFKWTRTPKGYELLCPWPLVQITNRGDHRKYFLPIWGRKTIAGTESSFIAWPLWRTSTARRGNAVVRRKALLPLVYHQSVTVGDTEFCPTTSARTPSEGGGGPGGLETGGVRVASSATNPVAGKVSGDGTAAGGPRPVVSERHLRVWPLFAYDRWGSAARLKALELWPLGSWDPIERNWAPFWTLYKRERSDTGAVSSTYLWGLLRHGGDPAGRAWWSVFPLFSSERSPAADLRSWSALLGAIRYEREALNKSWRILYLIRLGGGEPSETGAPPRDAESPRED